MTEIQKRIKIAEACRWKRHFGDGVIIGKDIYIWIDPDGRRKDGFWKSGDESQFLAVGIPDYFNSLDAMHEAEKTLKGGQECADYQGIIFEIEKRDQKHLGFMGLGCHATAAQRAEAFGKMFGLW